MKTTETVAQKALRLLQPIPARDFISGLFTDEISKCCVIGHYERLTSKDPKDYSEQNCSDISELKYPSDPNTGFFGCDLRQKSRKFMEEKYNQRWDSIVSINNHAGYITHPTYIKEFYPEKERKDRVIHFLNDMIAAGY